MQRRPYTQDILMEAQGLQVGQSVRTHCPACHGGNKRERSLSVSRDIHGILYLCYRDTCGLRGFEGTAAWSLPPGKKPQKVRQYTGQVLPLEAKDQIYFLNRFEIPYEVSERLIKRTGWDSYLFPIFAPNRLTRGFVIRQPWWKGDPAPRKGHPDPEYPKSNAFPEQDKPSQSWYAARRTQFNYPALYDGKLVVVEDQMSAIKTAHAGIHCVALLGTDATTEKVREWGTTRPQEVIIALDADATESAFKMAGKWGLAFPKVRVAMLERDLKDTPLDNIPEVLQL